MKLLKPNLYHFPEKKNLSQIYRIVRCEHPVMHAVPSPEGCPRDDLWGKREEAEGMVDTAGELAFFT